MSMRLADRLLLLGFLAAGLYYLYDTYAFLLGNPDAGIGPVQFPVLIGGLLIVLCLAALVVGFLKPDPEYAHAFEIPNAGVLTLSIAMTAVYIASWWWTRQFYPATAIFFFALVMVYLRDRSPRSIAIAAGVSIGFTVLLYLVFELAFSVQLS